MKPVPRLLLLFIMALIYSVPIFALPQDIVYKFNVVKTYNYDNYHVDEPPVGHRIPPQSLPCTISNDGIDIQGVDSSDIASFEIYTINGCLKYASLDLESFISSISNLEGEYEIRFITDSYTFKGYISF